MSWWKTCTILVSNMWTTDATLEDFSPDMHFKTPLWTSSAIVGNLPSATTKITKHIKDSEQYFIKNIIISAVWQQFVDSWQEVGMCISFVFLSGRIVPYRAQRNFNILFIFNLPFLFLHIGIVFLRGNVFCLSPILPNTSCPLYSPQLVSNHESFLSDSQSDK